MKTKTKKLVYGVGNNNADYAVEKKETIGYVDGKQKRKLVWVCDYYRTWKSMLKRCYSAKYQERCPTYKGCTVSEDWLVFTNFRDWMMAQDWEGKQLDKDLLFEGIKCTAQPPVFLSHQWLTHSPLIEVTTEASG